MLIRIAHKHKVGSTVTLSKSGLETVHLDCDKATAAVIRGEWRAGFTLAPSKHEDVKLSVGSDGSYKGCGALFTGSTADYIIVAANATALDKVMVELFGKKSDPKKNKPLVVQPEGKASNVNYPDKSWYKASQLSVHKLESKRTNHVH